MARDEAVVMDSSPDPQSLRLERLSVRERDCLRLVYAHHTSKSIALKLGFAKTSVDTYINRACAKLGLNDRKEAARLLYEHEQAKALKSATPALQAGALPAVQSVAPEQATASTEIVSTGAEAARPGRRLSNTLLQAAWLAAAFTGLAAVLATLLRTLNSNPELLRDSPAIGEVLILASALALAVTVPRSIFRQGAAERVFPVLLALGMGLAILNKGYGLLGLAFDLFHSCIATWIAFRDRRSWVIAFAAASWGAIATGTALFVTAGTAVARSNQVAFWTIYNLACYLAIALVVYGVWFSERRRPASALA